MPLRLLRLLLRTLRASRSLCNLLALSTAAAAAAAAAACCCCCSTASALAGCCCCCCCNSACCCCCCSWCWCWQLLLLLVLVLPVLLLLLLLLLRLRLLPLLLLLLLLLLLAAAAAAPTLRPRDSELKRGSKTSRPQEVFSGKGKTCRAEGVVVLLRRDGRTGWMFVGMALALARPVVWFVVGCDDLFHVVGPLGSWEGKNMPC
jgi:hypothetical protein